MPRMNKWINRETVPGLLLITAALLALLLSNSPWATTYHALLQTPFSVQLGDGIGLAKPLVLWINDGLMAVFFLLVALELKRELVRGELSNRRKIILPLAAAIGGIVVPAVIYVLANAGHPQNLRGWAIPAATDIAFVLGVLSLVGDRVPKALRLFLLSLAIFDDVGAILIIAVFYTEDISWMAKGLALWAIAVLFTFNRLGITRRAPYFLVGAFLWTCVLKSGVHATLAGVILGLMIPIGDAKQGTSPLEKLEHDLHPWVALGIVPIFAFANAGLVLKGMTADVLLHPVALGIAGGLVLGKTLGVYGFSMLMVRWRLASLPTGVTRSSLLAASLLAGIGFTMSLFVGTLAFESTWGEMSGPVRLGVLSASLISAVGGVVLLKRSLRSPRHDSRTVLEPTAA